MSIMNDILAFLESVFKDFSWKDIIDFFVMYYLIYRVLLLIKGTRAVQMLTGIGFVIIVALVSKIMQFSVMNWILDEFIISNIVLVFIILFQDDIRRALTRVGRNPFFSGLSSIEETQV